MNKDSLNQKIKSKLQEASKIGEEELKTLRFKSSDLTDENENDSVILQALNDFSAQGIQTIAIQIESTVEQFPEVVAKNIDFDLMDKASRIKFKHFILTVMRGVVMDYTPILKSLIESEKESFDYAEKVSGLKLSEISQKHIESMNILVYHNAFNNFADFMFDEYFPSEDLRHYEQKEEIAEDLKTQYLDYCGEKSKFSYMSDLVISAIQFFNSIEDQ